MTHNVGACAVAGLGGLENVAKRNVKPDQLRTVHEPKCFKETKLQIYRTLRYCICTLLCAVRNSLFQSLTILPLHVVISRFPV
jgi:hypothetical protein